MRPGPSTRMSLGCFGSDAGAGRTRLAVTDMQCFQRRSARRRRRSSAPSRMTANVHTEAKVPRIPQSESFRPVPRVSAVRVPSPGATVWLGVAVTAALFEIGKLLIGLYIGKQALESTYGRAAAFVVLLIW